MISLKTLVLEVLEDFKAQDVNAMDVRSMTVMTDYMIVATGNSNRHIRAIAENVIRRAKEQNYQPIGIEGVDEGEWILIDLSDVVVHIMLAKTREFYALEKLWGQSNVSNEDFKSLVI